jgi:hypothetical protein
MHGALHLCLTHILIFHEPTPMSITHMHALVCSGTSSCSRPQIVIVDVHGAITSKSCLICQKHVGQKRWMNIQVFWDVMLCSSASDSWHSKGRGSSNTRKMYLSQTAWTLKVKELCSFEMSGTTHQWHSIKSQKTWIFGNTALRTSALTEKEDYRHIATGATDRTWLFQGKVVGVGLAFTAVCEGAGVLLDVLPNCSMVRMFSSVSQDSVFSSDVWTASHLASVNTNVLLSQRHSSTLKNVFLSGPWWLGNMSWYTHCHVFFVICMAIHAVCITHFCEYVCTCHVYHNNMHHIVYWVT